MKKFKVFLGCVLLTGNRDGPSHDSSFTNEEGRGAAKLILSSCTSQVQKEGREQGERQVPPLGISSCQSKKQSNCKPRTSRQKVPRQMSPSFKSPRSGPQGKKVRLKPEPHQRLHSCHGRVQHRSKRHFEILDRQY